MCICISIVLYLELYFAYVCITSTLPLQFCIWHMAFAHVYIQHTYHLIPNQDVDSLQCCCAYCVCESTDEYGFRVSICIWFVYVLCIYTYFYTILYQGSRTPLFVVPVDGKEFSQEKQLPAKQNLPSWWLVVATSQRRFWLLNSCPLKNFSAAITCSSGKYKLEAKEVGMGIGKI